MTGGRTFMKKFLSILFCAVLLTTCFTKGFSLSAANTSAVSQQSAIPDHVNLKGENAIKDFYTKDGETLIPAIAAIYPMDCPSAENVDYILLYHYPNGTNYKGIASGQVFLIEDSQTIEQICQTLSKTNAECTTSRPDITGYDISDYKTEFSLELHSNKSTQIWNSLVGVENYLLRVQDKKIGNYTDLPFTSSKISSVISILEKLSNQSNHDLFSVLDEEPCIYRVNKTAHVYTTTDDLSKEQRDNIYKEYQTWSYTPISLKDAGELTQPNQYLALFYYIYFIIYSSIFDI